MNRSIAKVHQPLRLFIAYAEPDSRLRAELDLHLAPIRRQGEIMVWHVRLIVPGQHRLTVVDAQLEEADIILLLVSPDLLASDYVYETEVQRALERDAEGSATVIPILLRPCLWMDTPLGDLEPLPSNRRAIRRWSDRDSAWLHVAEELSGIVRKIRAGRLLLDPVNSALGSNINLSGKIGRDKHKQHEARQSSKEVPRRSSTER